MKFKSSALVSVRLDARTVDMLDRLSEPIDGNRSIAMRQAIRELAERRGLTEVQSEDERRGEVAEVSA